MKLQKIFFILAFLFCNAAAAVLTPTEQEVLQALDQDEISSKVVNRFLYQGENWSSVLRKVVAGKIKASSYQFSNAVFLLGRLGDPKAVPVLQSTLIHPDDRVRISGLRALGRIPSPESKAALNRFLEKDHLKTAEAITAVDALARIGTQSSIATLERLKSKPIYKGPLKQQVDLAIKKLESVPDEP